MKSLSSIRKKIIALLITAIFLIMCVGGIFAFKIFLNHEYHQSARISSLENQITLLEKRIGILEKNPKEIFPDGGGVNYLAIGNSITLHPLADYWWSECGMAASSPEKDYFHLVKTWLDDKYDIVNAFAYNFSMWEILHTDRAETIEILDYYLNNNIDLITVQLGENVSNLDTFESDFEYLLNHIKSMAPSAQIIVLGDIITDLGERDESKEKAAERCEIEYISFDGIKDNKEYQVGIGTKVYDSDGGEHVVEHDGVAVHPNDEAMKYIADRIIEKIQDLIL